jgi:hypothetical protein
MRLRFIVKERIADPPHDRSLLMLERTHLPALRTCLLLAQVLRLPLRRHLQGARQQRLDGRHGHVFHLAQIDIKPGTLLAPLLPHDDFSPATGQFLDPANIFWRRFACCHIASLQEFTSVSADEILPEACRSFTSSCKVGPALRRRNELKPL